MNLSAVDIFDTKQKGDGFTLTSPFGFGIRPMRKEDPFLIEFVEEFPTEGHKESLQESAEFVLHDHSLGIFLRLTSKHAYVKITEERWREVKEPVLLFITQYFRLALLQKELHRYQEEIKADASIVSSLGVPRKKKENKLREASQKLIFLSQAIAHFQGCDSFPERYLRHGRPKEIYSSLAKKLPLNDWLSSLSDQYQRLQETYTAYADTTLYHKHFFWTLVIEIVIVIALTWDSWLWILGKLKQ